DHDAHAPRAEHLFHAVLARQDLSRLDLGVDILCGGAHLITILQRKAFNLRFFAASLASFSPISLQLSCARPRLPAQGLAREVAERRPASYVRVGAHTNS